MWDAFMNWFDYKQLSFYQNIILWAYTMKIFTTNNFESNLKYKD